MTETIPGPSTQPAGRDDALQRLLDERAIEAVCIRYGTAIDDRDWDRLRTCFTESAVTEYEGLGAFEGYQAIEEVCRAAVTPLTRSQHLFGNITVDVTGDTATGQCYLQAQHVRTDAEGGPNFIIAGRYSDRFVRTEEGWRFAWRRLETWWTEGNPAVLQL